MSAAVIKCNHRIPEPGFVSSLFTDIWSMRDVNQEMMFLAAWEPQDFIVPHSPFSGDRYFWVWFWGYIGRSLWWIRHISTILVPWLLFFFSSTVTVSTSTTISLSSICIGCPVGMVRLGGFRVSSIGLPALGMKVSDCKISTVADTVVTLISRLVRAAFREVITLQKQLS